MSGTSCNPGENFRIYILEGSLDGIEVSLSFSIQMMPNGQICSRCGTKKYTSRPKDIKVLSIYQVGDGYFRKVIDGRSEFWSIAKKVAIKTLNCDDEVVHTVCNCDLIDCIEPGTFPISNMGIAPCGYYPHDLDLRYKFDPAED